MVSIKQTVWKLIKGGGHRVYKITNIDQYSCRNKIYCNVPEFSNRQLLANSADLDLTAPKGAVRSGSSLLDIPFHLGGITAR